MSVYFNRKQGATQIHFHSFLPLSELNDQSRRTILGNLSQLEPPPPFRPTMLPDFYGKKMPFKLLKYRENFMKWLGEDFWKCYTGLATN